MKKWIILFALCFCGFTLMAQSPLNIGIHGGVSNNKIKVKDAALGLKNGTNTGYMLGVFARINLGPLYVEPALNFSHKKGEVKDEVNKSALKYNSFDIPVMLGLHVIDVPALKLCS